MTGLTPLEWVDCECCGLTCSTFEAVEYYGRIAPWSSQRAVVWYCHDCNIECHGLGEECKVLERLDYADYARQRRPITDEELSEVREMVERSARRLLNLNVRLNSEEESLWRVSSTG